MQEGHQEAVMWFTAINELWMFVFGAAALWWGVLRGRRIAGLVLFGLALISKESAVIFLPLLCWHGYDARNWRRPSVAEIRRVLAAIVTGSIFLTRDSSFRFADGSFSLHAPFWITWPRGIFRVMWIWGWISAAILWFRGDGEQRRSAALAVAWIAIALVPYSFLTYSTAIPSRQTYLATVGLCVLFGLAVDTFTRRDAVDGAGRRDAPAQRRDSLGEEAGAVSRAGGADRAADSHWHGRRTARFGCSVSRARTGSPKKRCISGQGSRSRCSYGARRRRGRAGATTTFCFK